MHRRRPAATATVTPATVAAIVLALITGCAPSEPTPPASWTDIFGGIDHADADQEAMNREREELISQCMRNLGWEYIAVEWPAVDQELTKEAFQAQTYERGWSHVWNVLYGEDDILPRTDWVDPNAEYVSSLTLGESQAYMEALYGTPAQQEAATVTFTDPATGDTVSATVGNNPGCAGQAADAVEHRASVTDPQGLWDAMQVHYQAMDDTALADPRKIALDATYQACMTEHGFAYTDPLDFFMRGYRSIDQRLEEILADAPSRTPFDGWTEDEIAQWYSSTSQTQRDAYLDEVARTPYDAATTAALEELMQDEIALAVADQECSGTYQDEWQAIQDDVQAQYVTAHEAELRAIAAQFLDPATP